MIRPEITYQQICEIYQRFEEYQPPKPIKLTRWQLNDLAFWLWLNTDPRTAAARAVEMAREQILSGVPVVVVDTEAESTPYEMGWHWAARSASPGPEV